MPERTSFTFADLRPCPLCGVESIGWPIRDDEGCEYSGYAGADAWVFRLDLDGWVCKTCHERLGPDDVRERLIAQCAPVQPAPIIPFPLLEDLDTEP